MKRLTIAFVLIIVFIGTYYYFSSSSFESASFHASDSNSIVFRQELQKEECRKALFF